MRTLNCCLSLRKFLWKAESSVWSTRFPLWSSAWSAWLKPLTRGKLIRSSPQSLQKKMSKSKSRTKFPKNAFSNWLPKCLRWFSRSIQSWRCVWICRLCRLSTICRMHSTWRAWRTLRTSSWRRRFRSLRRRYRRVMPRFRRWIASRRPCMG